MLEVDACEGAMFRILITDGHLQSVLARLDWLSVRLFHFGNEEMAVDLLVKCSWNTMTTSFLEQVETTGSDLLVVFVVPRMKDATGFHIVRHYFDRTTRLVRECIRTHQWPSRVFVMDLFTIPRLAHLLVLYTWWKQMSVVALHDAK